MKEERREKIRRGEEKEREKGRAESARRGEESKREKGR
jgi:hypothetical protein